MSLIKYEFLKISKSNYFIGSMLIVLLSPLFSLLWMSLNPRGFVLGDFNEMNIMLLSLIGSKTLFPMTGMLLIKIEYDQKGWVGAFVTPTERSRILMAKIVVAMLWSIFLVFFSMLIVIITEVILFNDLNIISLVFRDNLSYYMMILYVVPYIVIGMTVSFFLEHIVMPLIGFVALIFIGYFTQLFYESLYLPSALPKFIMSLEWHRDFGMAYFLLYIIGFIALIMLWRGIYHKDY